MAKKETNYHDKGQEDASSGKNDPPHQRMPFFGDLLAPLNKEQREDRDAYHQGRKNYEKTKK